MSPLRKIAEIFENWIDPLAPVDNLRPPDNITGFFWHYIRQAKLPFLAVLALTGTASVLEALLFFYVGRLVDILEQLPDGEGWAALLAGYGGELALMLFVVVVVRFAATTIASLVDEQVISRGFFTAVNWQSFIYVARQSVGFFANRSSGSVQTKVGQVSNAMGNVATGVIDVVWSILVFTVTTLVLFAQLDLTLMLAVVLWMALFGGLARYFLPRLRANAAKLAEASASLNGRVVDMYSNIQTVKLFGTVEENDSYMRAGFTEYLRRARNMGRISIGLRSSMTLLSAVMLAGIAILCVDLWARGAISVGSVAFALALVMRLSMWLGRLMGGLNGLMRNFGVVQNSMETVSRPIEVVDAPNALDWTPVEGHIRFEGVNFSYLASREIVEDLTLDIRPGEKVGLVGMSGAGKTTIVNLLLRFYDLDSGRITIDGQDIAAVKQDCLRRGIGVVTQETAILNRSVRDNIKFGRPGASDEEMVAAATQAGADRFIADIVDPAGRRAYDAHIGERGVKLSGGQRQRLAIARVMLKNAPILVLDEATSALDSEVEAAIQEQFTRLMRGKTVIAIAHRLSTIAAMDRLIVIEAGKIVEEGTHHELLARQGIYARLWARQSGGFLQEDATERLDLAEESLVEEEREPLSPAAGGFRAGS